MQEQQTIDRAVPPAPAVDRPVFVADVMPFAKRGCSRCYGKGTITKVMHAGAKGETRVPDACMCAVRRFKKRHAADVVQLNINGQDTVLWLPGKAPALATEQTDAQPAVADPQ